MRRFMGDAPALPRFLGDRAKSFADDLARYLPGGAGDACADLARLSDELLYLKVTAADVEHARRRPSDPTLAAWIHRLRDAAHDADDLLDDSEAGGGRRTRRRQAGSSIGVFSRSICIKAGQQTYGAAGSSPPRSDRVRFG
ncbi:hypothetical protein ZWY2020_004155 [Hordeum vulgare]|nr:hypothetical protein ZWY2020_004155 [Hordeum vulgare]